MGSRALALAAAVLGLGVASAVAVAYARRTEAVTMASERVPSPRAPQAASALPAAPSAEPPRETPFSLLSPLRFTNVNTRESAELRLYDASGNVDPAAAAKLDALLCDARDPKQVKVRAIDRRTLMLMYRAAYHFGAREVQVISGYRQPGRHREGLHAKGVAVDFKLPDVKAAELASYLRKLPRVGVGVYTHPRTQYVHLDVRDESYHWIDASPPHRSWREQSLGRIAPAHDASYRPEMDLPESVVAALQP